MVRSAIFKSCENEYWQEVLQVNQTLFPETSLNVNSNKNVKKLSCSYCRNIGSVIASHNRRIIL